MYRFKSKHRGYIVVFTLIIISIIMGIFLYSFKLEVSKKMRNYSYKSIELSDDIYSKQREYLLARLNNFITEKCKDINEENLNLILNSVNDETVSYENTFVKFDDKNKNIILNLQNEKGVKREDVYNYEIDEKSNIVRFKYLISKYK
ncbi:hypothetical protein [Clostridium novyi]|uniref:Uncharacterized protein n=1 Tax=Clostridium novyi (strain NT) TaxID=386415 RepID=A0Q083_CLONN|nr:hypothetical protein [Clostridium novyi]ABK61066.1 hypothetical protein NT01CX_1962 [Clostridium novyi NT]KEH85483.1 hypothetical protein Z966_06885 [Clostridium novyi A str. NCTC 538]